ncbi:MAG: hypothetical protein QOG48_227 [Verrucomicrobiota bacterium]|jgi:hypothetical protein
MLRSRSGRGSFAWQLSILLLSIFVSAAVALAASDKPKGAGKKKKKGTRAAKSGSPGDQSLTNIPLPIGHEAKGLVLPDFNADGKLVGRFEAGTAKRLDQERVEFRDLKIVTFTPENQIDLQVDMHTSIFNLNTRVLSSDERSTVRRADFNIVGDSAKFDTQTRTGTMIGNVKMVINGQSDLMKRATPPTPKP